jgi:hypothetical protein
LTQLKKLGTGGFKKENVVTTDEKKYPQDIQIQFVQDKVDLLDKFKIGESVKIGINLRGRSGLMQRRNSLFQYYSGMEYKQSRIS